MVKQSNNSTPTIKGLIYQFLVALGNASSYKLEKLYI